MINKAKPRFELDGETSLQVGSEWVAFLETSQTQYSILSEQRGKVSMEHSDYFIGRI